MSGFTNLVDDGPVLHLICQCGWYDDSVIYGWFSFYLLALRDVTIQREKAAEQIRGRRTGHILALTL